MMVVMAAPATSVLRSTTAISPIVFFTSRSFRSHLILHTTVMDVRASPIGLGIGNAKKKILKWKLDWRKEFNDTDLASQCTHRYKIYVEGNAWCECV
ncbi:putative glycosyl transferase CAP10 domain-containing protein [Helianthus annuus]|nr:putative glycosyl transferase CAP10 domain-containing protein [Helianthus annuus]